MSDNIKIRKVKQLFNDEKITDITGYIHRAVQQSDLSERIKPGARIGITAGSRGIVNLKEIIKSIVAELKALNANPFIIPAMGSHGGATAEGQKEVLASYGLTEEKVGAAIVSSTATVKIGEVAGGIPVYFSRDALEADGIIALNRVKMHTDIISDTLGSGMLKVLVIGLGKAKGASYIHSLGLYGLRELIPAAAELIIDQAPIIQGVGIIENGYDQTMKIEFINPEDIRTAEIRLLKESKTVMPSLPVDQIDLLIIQEMGKDISGSGFDTNIIGRLDIYGEAEFDSPKIKRIAVFDLTKNSHGNALGIGLADLTTRKLVDQIDYTSTYANVITSTFLKRGKIPLTTATEEEAVEIALKTCWLKEGEKVRLLIIKNTLDLEYIYVSESVWNELKDHDKIEGCGNWVDLSFDDDGKMKERI